jgi:hypothetical protein
MEQFLPELVALGNQPGQARNFFHEPLHQVLHSFPSLATANPVAKRSI